MATIKEAYCSFEVAKLLKEKGFDEKCVAYYPQYITPIKLTFGGRVNYNASNKFKMSPPISAPTHQMAMKWLREVHNIFIIIEPYFYDYVNERTKSYVTSLWQGDNYYENITSKDYPTYEEAVEAALKYSLKNLI